MNCSRFRSELKSRAENRSLVGAAESGLREHLANCSEPACREAWLDACLLEQAIGEWADGFPHPDLGERVVGELRSKAVASEAPAVRVARDTVAPAGRNSLRWIVVSAALVVLVSLVVVVSSPEPLQMQTIAERETPEFLDVAPPAPDVGIAPRRDEAELSSTYLGLAEGATQFLTDTVALTLAGEEDIEEPTAAADWIHRMEDRLGPLGEDFDTALDQFLRSIPDSET